MSWERIGDKAATDPRVLRLGERRREVFGFLVLVGSLSGQHLTDGVIDQGMARLVGDEQWAGLVAECMAAGLLTKVPRKQQWRLVDDPELIHLRSRAEIEWTRQRQRDNSNPRLTMPVKERDGDACRYCGVVVYWAGDRRSKKAGTYDHRAKPATVDTLVVACAECNGSRGGYAGHGMSLEQIDELVPLQPPPPEPYYSAFTATQLSKHFGRPFEATKARPGTQPDTAHPARPRTTEPVAPSAATGQQARPGTQPRTAAEDRRDPAASRGPQPERRSSQLEAAPPPALGDGYAAPSGRGPAPPGGITAGQGVSRSADSGRSEVSDPGRVGSGRDGSPLGAPGHPRDGPARRRGSRGGRGRRTT